MKGVSRHPELIVYVLGKDYLQLPAPLGFATTCFKKQSTRGSARSLLSPSHDNKQDDHNDGAEDQAAHARAGCDGSDG